MNKLFIWGAGTIGKRIVGHFDSDWDITFVDSNDSLVGIEVVGKKVISVNEYLEKYSKDVIVIAHLYEEEALKILNQNKIINYFLCYDFPAEFNEPYIRNHLKDYIIGYLNSRTDYVLYGLNIYSIVISDWIKKTFGISPYILLQNDLSEEYVENIKKRFPNINIIAEENLCKFNAKEICVCTPNYVKIKESTIFESFVLTDLFDCSDKIEVYHNPEIERFYNVHKGKRCFIVANGPSLRIEDLDRLYNNNEYCIGMNYIYYIFDKTKWRPSYYVMDDSNALINNVSIIDKITELCAFIGDTSELFWKKSHRSGVHRYHKCYEYGTDIPKFSANFAQKVYTGATVTYSCLQLAVYMGFSEIYLLGVDFSYAKTGGIYKHFYGEDKPGCKSRGFHKYVANAYMAAKQYADRHNIKIYNATRGGCLETFERVEFDTLFKF